MNAIYFALSLFAILIFSFFIGKLVFKNKKNASVAIRANIAVFVMMVIMCSAVAFSASAAETRETVNMQTTSAAAPDNSRGMGFIASALAVGLAGIGGGIAVGSAAPAAIGATSEDPKNFGKSLIFVVLGEGIALYGLLMSFMIYSSVSQ